MKQSRRQFCQTIGYTSAALFAGSTAHAYCRQLPTVSFGNTGLQVSRIGLCTSQLHLAPSPSEADYTVRYLLDCGVNYFDTSPNYGAGFAENLLGKIISPQRENQIITTKTRYWNNRKALLELEASLKRLNTDYVDVWMIDNPPVKHIEDVCSDHGVLAAAIQAKKQGKCRYIGFSGQSHPQWLLDYCRQYKFDVIQMPLNAVDPHYLSFEETALSQYNINDTAIVGNKTFALEQLRNSTLIHQSDALNYALSLPVTVTLVNCSIKEQAVSDIHTTFHHQPVTEKEKNEILSISKLLSNRDVEWYKAMV